MENPQRSARSRLKDWEDWLAPQVRQVELLGEIPITADECAQLSKAIGLRMRALGHNRGVRTLRREYPCALAVYLVAQGVYGYQGGDYWSEIIQATGLKSAYTWQLGQAFESILEEIDLPLFYDMRKEAHRYVSLILAHGGIPNYCLPDFFKNMLQPSVLRMQYADMATAELIDEWQWRANTQYFTDKPVIRFLVYGDRVAEDFVERCREMAREYLDSGLVPDAGQVGLPERVVEAYCEWVLEQGTEQVERETGDRWRHRKPEVLVDPWGEGVILDLPPQQVPATEIHTVVTWQVKGGADNNYTIPVHIHRRGFAWKTTAETLPLRQPEESYEVSLLTDGQVKNTWRYQGVDDKHPLLVFDAERGSLLKQSYSLPARRLGLLYPAHLDIRVEGDASLDEEWPRLPWGWAAFRGQTWDLSGADHFNLREDGQDILTVMLRPDEARQQPTLEGGRLLAPAISGTQTPVYEGSPPSVCIPLTGRRNLDEELVRWRVTVQNKWTASPSLKLTKTLADLRSQLVIREGHIKLPLCDGSLLGEQPFGSYLVRLRGPLGRGAEFTLRIVPHLVIAGHEDLYLPDAKYGPMPATLLAETLSGYYLECESIRGMCSVEATSQQGDRWEYQVKVDPDVTDLELTLIRQLSSGDSVRVPVPVPIRRLRWALMSDQTDVQRRNWTGRIVNVPVDALLQDESPCLLVELPTRRTEEVHVGLRLVDVDGDVLQVTDPISLATGRRLLRLDLAAFLDTIQSSRSPFLRLELEGYGLPGKQSLLRWPALSLTQAMSVNNIGLKVHRDGMRASFELQWHEPTPLKNRHVCFWPLWRPWDPFFEKSIPDTAEGVYTFDVPPERLRSGKYRLQFLVVDPWVPQKPQKPQKDTPGTADVALISSDRQLQWLDARIKPKEQQFELLLERAVLCYDVGNAEQAQTDCQQCFDNLDEGTIPQILVLRDLFKAFNDGQNSLKALQLKMAATTRVERLVRDYKHGEILGEHFREYLSSLPIPALLPQKTCEYLLEVSEEAQQLQALEALIRRSNQKGLDAVLSRVENAELSDADAVALLKRNTDYSVDYLKERASDPSAMRLLRAISQDLADRIPIVQIGIWVFCDAGWGRIEQIEDANSHPVEHFIRGQASYLLHVTLRPSVDAEPVIVDLARHEIRFPKANSLWTCAKCNRFSARDSNLVVEGHNRVAHNNLGPSLRKERMTTRSLRVLEYNRKAPREQLSVPPRPESRSEPR